MMHKIIKKIAYAEVSSPLLRELFKFVYRFGETYAIPFGRLAGLRLKYDESINLHAMLGAWELRNFAFLNRIFAIPGVMPKAPIICDVGANIGMYSMWFSRQFPEGSIYAFEPLPEIFQKLKSHVHINGISNIHCFDLAVTDKVGAIDFFIGYHNLTSSIHPEWASGGNKIKGKSICANTTDLDSFFYSEKREPPDIIKMDIEGGGSLALKGGDRCFSEKRPLILIESHIEAEGRAICNLVSHYRYRAFPLLECPQNKNGSLTEALLKDIRGLLFLYPEETHQILSDALKY